MDTFFEIPNSLEECLFSQNQKIEKKSIDIYKKNHL